MSGIFPQRPGRIAREKIKTYGAPVSQGEILGSVQEWRGEEDGRGEDGEGERNEKGDSKAALG